MRTLLREIVSGLYFQGPGKWTDNPAQALDFKFMDRALRYAQTWNLTKVELAFAFEDAAGVTAVPLENAVRRSVVSP